MNNKPNILFIMADDHASKAIRGYVFYQRRQTSLIFYLSLGLLCILYSTTLSQRNHHSSANNHGHANDTLRTRNILPYGVINQYSKD